MADAPAGATVVDFDLPNASVTRVEPVAKDGVWPGVLIHLTTFGGRRTFRDASLEVLDEIPLDIRTFVVHVPLDKDPDSALGAQRAFELLASSGAGVAVFLRKGLASRYPFDIISFNSPLGSYQVVTN